MRSAIGLGGYHLSDMDEIATISHQYYDNHLRGGEGHMEVGKLIQHVEQRKAHMVISVKPFGCMPSSGVSDGVQSLVTARHPDAIFCAIETTGDGAVNVQSRVLMYLFKARQKAQKEYEGPAAGGEAVHQRSRALDARRRGLNDALFYPRHVVAGTAANTIFELRPELKKDSRSAGLPPSQKPQRTAVASTVSFRNGSIPLIAVGGTGSRAKD